MATTLAQINLLRAATLLFMLTGVASAADRPGVRAVLYPEKGRKPAADFALQDPTGKTIKIRDYRGKVVLLDFWATWCTGCKTEIPWFSEFQKTYGSKRFAVVGVSMDDGGWNVIKPFLAHTQLSYRMLLGDEVTAKRYGIDSLPDAFLVDRQGKIAAAYTTGMVDRDNLAANIQALLAGR